MTKTLEELSAELLACPICGPQIPATPFIMKRSVYDVERTGVGCNSCWMTGSFSGTPEENVANWNRLSALTGQVRIAREALGWVAECEVLNKCEGCSEDAKDALARMDELNSK